MNNYYCKNCKYSIGELSDDLIHYDFRKYCYFLPSINSYLEFLHCKNCKHFIGIICYYVCKNCFGEKQILGEKNLLNWFIKYRITNPQYYDCEICKKDDFRQQYWLFEELTFIKNKIK